MVLVVVTGNGLWRRPASETETTELYKGAAVGAGAAVVVVAGICCR